MSLSASESASSGADCKLSDFRFVSGTGRDLQLITAEREYGTTYVDEGVVTFTYYQLKQNADVQMGRPLYYFENVKTSKAAKTYCDVDEIEARATPAVSRAPIIWHALAYGSA